MAREICVGRARKWLNCNRLGGIEPSALLVARLEARRRGSWITVLAVSALFPILLGWSVINNVSGSEPNPDEAIVDDLVLFLVTNVLIVLGLFAGMGYAYRMERRLLATRRTRSAHPAVAGVTRVLGAGHVAAVGVVHGGGLLLGVATTLLAPRPDRPLALAFLVSVAVLAVLSGLALTGVLRRPSVAEDPESLLVDDVLRSQDARVAVLPLPIVVALVAAIGESITPWLLWTLLGYVAIGTVAWVLAERSARRAPSGLAVTGG